MKHKLSEMIKAKVENMNLVIFVNNCQNEGAWWALKSDNEILPSFANAEYFACLPQHKEAVLNSLNGSESQLSFDGALWAECNCNQPIEWNVDWWYMRPESQSRIKPKKEKRWVVVNPSGNSVNVNLMKTEPDISEYPDGCQAIKIEVEA